MSLKISLLKSVPLYVEMQVYSMTRNLKGSILYLYPTLWLRDLDPIEKGFQLRRRETGAGVPTHKYTIKGQSQESACAIKRQSQEK
jgi:hypothetical protein